MSRRPTCLALGVLLATSGHVAFAQHRFVSERRDARDFTTDIWSVWISPSRIQSRDAFPTILAVGGTLLTSHFDSTSRAWMTGHEGSLFMRMLGPIRENARFPAYELGSGQYLLPLSGALYAAGRFSRSPGLRDAGLGCAAGHVASLGLREVTYHLVARARPSVTADPFRVSVPGSHRWLLHSFFSGHIANSMACASFVSHRYSLGAIEPFIYAYPVAIGLGRMADGAHWASDTMTGALVGFAIGKAIADRQLGRGAARLTTSNGSPANRHAGLTVPVLSWSIGF